MKNISKIMALLLSGILVAATFPARGLEASGKRSGPVQSVQAKKGAANTSELGRMVLQAIQKNNFADLNNFLLDDEALIALKKKGSEDLKALLQNTTAENIKSNIKIKYDDLVQQGISRTINWSEMALAETALGKGSPKNPMILPLTLTFTNQTKPPVQLILETAKLNNRYYLFQRMELKS